ncbi:unnamed protein product [Paramecium primaurelia]|uniref:Uncharacterized protein n=1 Tax=Paramecium primaurelia TaxID=5886 RepID=A0A8S1QGE2_PARPR|nr:unnamed protein product [Paramecium primaurelia]
MFKKKLNLLMISIQGSEIVHYKNPQVFYIIFLVVDEDYEIIGKSQNDNSICPICYQYMKLGNTQLYSNHLSIYFDVHTQCALMQKQQLTSLVILHENIKLTKFVKCIPVDYDLLDLNIKAFVEFQVFHIIAQKPFLHLTHSTTLKLKKNTSILIDYANLKQYYGKCLKYIIPFLQERIQVQLYIIDANLIQKGKDAHTYEFYYNAEQSTIGAQFSLESCGVCISMQLEEDIIQLSIKSLQIILPTKLTQIGPIQTRITYQIFNLKKLQQKNGLKIFRILNRLEVKFRLIQKHFKTCTQKELDQMLQDIGSHPLDLMIHPYANYMFVSLSQSYATHQRLYILQTIGNRLADIACDKKELILFSLQFH